MCACGGGVRDDCEWRAVRYRSGAVRTRLRGNVCHGGVLSTLAGVRIGEVGEVLIDEGVAVADLVARLVQAGVRISAVEPSRRNLEQIYLEMSHANGAPPP